MKFKVKLRRGSTVLIGIFKKGSYREETRDRYEFGPDLVHNTVYASFATFTTLEIGVHNNLKIKMRKLRFREVIVRKGLRLVS